MGNIDVSPGFDKEEDCDVFGGAASILFLVLPNSSWVWKCCKSTAMIMKFFYGLWTSHNMCA